MRRLSGFDAQFLAAEAANTYGHYASLAVLEPHEGVPVPDRDRLIALVEERIDRIRPLRWRLKTAPLGLDYPHFADGEVDVPGHIFETSVPEATDAVATDIAQRMMSEPMDRERPLWEMHVITEPQGRRGYLITKLHHAVADGISAAVVLGLLCDDVPTGRVLPAPDEIVAADPGQAEMLVRGLFGAAMHPLRALRVAPGALPHLDQIPALRSLPGVGAVARGAGQLQRLRGEDSPDHTTDVAPRTRINGALSDERRVAFASIPIGAIKQVKAAAGVTFNDVVIALMAGAMRRRLGDELPEDPLLAFVPASMRPVGDGTFGNAISSYVVPIPTDVDTPAGRILAAHTVMAAAKQRHLAVPSTLLADANMLIPPALFKIVAGGAMQLMASGRVAPPINLMISNVPGPPVPMFCAGSRILAHFPLSLVMAGVGLNITVVSYDEQLDVGLVGDRDLMPDVWDLMSDITLELEALLAPAEGAGATA
jgi:WS/DGAT/MGAT family acyltransferase